jgi:hypothetical protein
MVVLELPGFGERACAVRGLESTADIRRGATGEIIRDGGDAGGTQERLYTMALMAREGSLDARRGVHFPSESTMNANRGDKRRRMLSYQQRLL